MSHQPHHAIITQVVSVLLENPFANYSMILSMVYEQNFSAANFSNAMQHKL